MPKEASTFELIQSLKSIPSRVPEIRKRCALLIALSTSGLAALVLFYLYRRRRRPAIKGQQRSSSCGRPVKHVDPRVTATSVSSFRFRRPFSEEDRRNLRREQRYSRASSIDRASISSVRSNRPSAEDSLQPLGELNMTHYTDVLNTFQKELEEALIQYTSRKQSTRSVSFSQGTKKSIGSASAGSGTVYSTAAATASKQSTNGVSESVMGSSFEASKASTSTSGVYFNQQHMSDNSCTPVNSKELISKLQKLLDLASELHLKNNELDKSRESLNPDIDGSIIEEEPLEEALQQMGLRASNPLRGDDERSHNGGNDDSSSTLSFRSVEEDFATSPFVSDDDPSHQRADQNGSVNPFTRLPKELLNKISGVNSSNENLQRSKVVSPRGSVRGLVNPLSDTEDDFHSLSSRRISQDGQSVTSNEYRSPGELSRTLSYHTAGYNAFPVSSPLSAPFLSAIGSPVNEVAEVNQMFLYEQGLNAVNEDAVPCRVLRAELLNLGSDSEFLAKLFGIRKALSLIFSDETNRDFLKSSGKRVVSDFLVCCNHSPTDFQSAFDEIISFCDNQDNWDVIEDELGNRGVVDMNFFDIVIDFIFLDAFDDLESPPSSIINVLQNRWLSQSFKETALRTAVWSVLKAKRSRLRYPDGFINRFYAISEVISPIFAYGFLGPPGDLQDLCLFFKGEVLDFVRKMFDQNYCRFSTESDLAEDLLALTREKVAIVRQRFNEILPMVHQQ